MANNKNHKKLEEAVRLEPHKPRGSSLKDVILGGQDGLVNVLGILLGIASATNNIAIVIIAGLVATFAESISMAAVAYTSSQAAKSFYDSELAREMQEVEQVPEIERQEIRDIFAGWGFRGKTLEEATRHIVSDKKRWVDFMMAEELRMFPDDYANPIRNAAVVGISATIGSLIPLAPFLLFPVKEAIIVTLALSTAVLFAVGAYKAKTTVGSWLWSGIELALIGMAAALVGYGIGAVIGNFFGINASVVG